MSLIIYITLYNCSYFVDVTLYYIINTVNMMVFIVMYLLFIIMYYNILTSKNKYSTFYYKLFYLSAPFCLYLLATASAQTQI